MNAPWINKWMLVHAVLLYVSVAAAANAQGPTVSRWLSCQERTCNQRGADPHGAGGGGGAPVNSPWIRMGAQLGFKLAGSGNLADDFLSSARVELEAIDFGQSNSLQIPVIGNLSALKAPASATDVAEKTKELLNSAEGINIGLSPYYTVFDAASSNKKPHAQLTFYGYGGWKLNAAREFSDSSKTFNVNSFRASVGVSLDAYVLRDTAGGVKPLPLTLTVEPVYTVVNASDYRRAYGTDKSDNLASLELTAVVPLGGVGLLSQVNLNEHAGPTWRVGILYVKGDPVKVVNSERKDSDAPARPAGAPSNDGPAKKEPAATVPTDGGKPAAAPPTTPRTW